MKDKDLLVLPLYSQTTYKKVSIKIKNKKIMRLINPKLIKSKLQIHIKSFS